MIDIQQLLQIGTFTKPHGLKGEISLSLQNDFDMDECDCVIVPIEGIPVPFFVSEIRGKGAETLLFTIDDIESAEDARMLCGAPVYVDKSLSAGFDDDMLPVNLLVGFEIRDVHHGTVGIITDVDTSTPNTLFLVNDIMIPAAEEYIVSFDDKKRIIEMELPEGLLDL
ncbi:MAG: ribosome maturation factor RimM [Paludibacteraceae bacterium]|nr:ribosome maturation factor RimM [Paludibacteraceae bacterium]